MSHASPFKVTEAISVIQGVDLLLNRRGDDKLGPWDGRVGAHVVIKGASCFITTNTTYVPAPPLPALNDGVPAGHVRIRKDMRWGVDDPCYWPQEFIEDFVHVACIPRPGSDAKREAMWWDPCGADFVSPATGETATRGLGKLSMLQISRLAPLVYDLQEECKDYIKSFVAPKTSPRLIEQLMEEMQCAMDRLTSIPSTYDRMLLGVRSVQRTYLELVGLLQYMKVYGPRMSRGRSGGFKEEAPPVDDCVGVFVSSPEWAENLHSAGVPFWLIRPMDAFTDVIIMKVVEPLDPLKYLEVEPSPSFGSIPAGPTLKDRLRAYHLASRSHPWYFNPLQAALADRDTSISGNTDSSLDGACAAPSSAGGSSKKAAAGRVGVAGQKNKPAFVSSAASGSTKGTQGREQSGGQRGGKKNGAQRYTPYPKPSVQKTSVERDKYIVFDSPYMAPAIPAWQRALSSVDRGPRASTAGRPLNRYVLPEPALLISSEARRPVYLYHYQLMRHALQYLLGNPQDPPYRGLVAQEWRDVLAGKVVEQGAAGSEARARAAVIEEVLGPAMRACGLDVKAEFPAKQLEAITPTRGQELTWELAEMSFRFELPLLDAMASGRARSEECLQCFPGKPIGPELAEGKMGFAALQMKDRLPHLLQLAGLMRAWRPHRLPRPDIITRCVEEGEWTTERIRVLEEAVAMYYTQTFYEYFGRAAIIPMRLEHEFGTGEVRLSQSADVWMGDPGYEEGELDET